MSNDARMTKLCEVWERVSKNGNTYFSGYLGVAQLLMFREGERAHPTKPDETVTVWNVLLQERDQSRRPAQQGNSSAVRAKPPPPARDGEGYGQRPQPQRPQRPARSEPPAGFYDDVAEFEADLGRR